MTEMDDLKAQAEFTAAVLRGDAEKVRDIVQAHPRAMAEFIPGAREKLLSGSEGNPQVRAAVLRLLDSAEGAARKLTQMQEISDRQQN